MKKRKQPKQNKGFFYKMVHVLLACASFFFIWEGLMELKTMWELNASIKETKIRIQELEEQKTELEKKKKDLSDPDYIEYIARGKYLVTKEGEQVFKFPSANQQEDQD